MTKELTIAKKMQDRRCRVKDMDVRRKLSEAARKKPKITLPSVSIEKSYSA